MGVCYPCLQTFRELMTGSLGKYCVTRVVTMSYLVLRYLEWELCPHSQQGGKCVLSGHWATPGFRLVTYSACDFQG